MNRKITVLTLCAMLLALTVPGQAQQPTKIPRIGVLGASPLSANLARIKAFREGLGELGYVEGKSMSSSGDFWRIKWTGYQLLPLS